VAVGRTNPTYRDRLEALEADLAPYRRGLRASEQEHFDQLFEHGRTYAHAAGYLNHPDPELPYLLSVLLAHQRRIAALTEQVETLQAETHDAVHD
jgi:hypothetical protein